MPQHIPINWSIPTPCDHCWHPDTLRVTEAVCKTCCQCGAQTVPPPPEGHGPHYPQMPIPGAPVFNITINTQPGQDGRAIAELVAREIRLRGIA